MKMEKGEQHSSGHHMMPAAATEKNVRALKITAFLTGIYFVIELGIGIYKYLGGSSHRLGHSSEVFSNKKNEPSISSPPIPVHKIEREQDTLHV
jgi:hypothetical protein